MYLAQLVLLDQKKANLPNAKPDAIKIVFTDLFVIIGALAFLMIVIAGLRYILARGDPSKVSAAKNMIMYSLIGLVIAALASSIVNLIVDKAQ